MNKNILVYVAVALVLGFGLGWLAVPKQGGSLGASITAYNCLNNAALCNSLNSIVADLNTVNNANIVAQATTSYTIPALGPLGSATDTTSTFVTIAGAAVGDYAEALIATSTGWDVESAKIVAASSGIVVFKNASTTGTSAKGASVLTIFDYAAATYGKSSTLVTTTSTTF